MGASCIECLLFHARGCVEGGCSGEIEIGRNDDVEGRKVGSEVRLCANVIGIDMDVDTRVELADLWCSSFGAILAYIGFLDEKLGGQIVFSDSVMIDDGEGTDAREDQILCDFICDCLDTDEEDVGLADAVVS